MMIVFYPASFRKHRATLWTARLDGGLSGRGASTPNMEHLRLRDGPNDCGFGGQPCLRRRWISYESRRLRAGDRDRDVTRRPLVYPNGAARLAEGNVTQLRHFRGSAATISRSGSTPSSLGSSRTAKIVAIGQAETQQPTGASGEGCGWKRRIPRF